MADVALSITDRIWEATLTVERIVHLGVQLCVQNYLADDVFEFLADSAEQTLFEAIARHVAELRPDADPITLEEYRAALDQFGDRAHARHEAMTATLRPLTGWLVEVTAPRIDWDPATRSGSVHGGIRTAFVAYADTYDQALEQAVALGEAHTRAPWDEA